VGNLRKAGLIRLIIACGCACAVSAAAGEEEPKIEAKPLSQWITQLNDANRGLQARAARGLSEASRGLRPTIIPRLIPLLKAERKNLLCWVAQVLGNYGPEARAAVPDLLPLLKGTQYERNRAGAAKALGQILEDAEPSAQIGEVAEALAAKFGEEYDLYVDVRREAAHAIGMIGPAAGIVIPKLTRALTDPAGQVRQQGAWACGRMGPPAREHTDRLISMLQQEGQRVPEIVWALGEIGPIHENVIPNIVDKLEKSLNLAWYEGHIFRSVEALGKFGPKSASAVDFLAVFLKSGGYNARILEQTLKTLAAIGPGAQNALEQVRRFKDRKNVELVSNMRGGSHEEIAAIVRAAEEAEKAIAAAKDQDDADNE
jgi:HEAT repeat protein